MKRLAKLRKKFRTQGLTPLEMAELFYGHIEDPHERMRALEADLAKGTFVATGSRTPNGKREVIDPARWGRPGNVSRLRH